MDLNQQVWSVSAYSANYNILFLALESLLLSRKQTPTFKQAAKKLHQDLWKN